MSNTIAYDYGDKLYLNITNRCPCHCKFCIRNFGDSVNENESLWLENEPTEDEIKAALSRVDFSAYREVVFCGYGEPTERLDVVIAIGKLIRSTSNIPIRINTNGMSDLINGEKTAEKLADAVDIISVSLNAPTKEEYFDLCAPDFGIDAFDAMLSFARDCKQCAKTVFFSIVDVLDEEKIAACQRLCDEIGIPLRIRKMGM